MKDLLVVLIFIAILLPIFRYPFVGIAAWIWTAMIYLNNSLYGFANAIQFNKITAGVTMFSTVINWGTHKKPTDALGFLVAFFFGWTILTSYTAIGNPVIVWDEFEKFAKIVLLFFFTRFVLHKKIHYTLLSFGLVLSIGFYAFVEGLKFAVTLGSHHAFGPGRHILADNNHLAVGIVMIIPVALYLAGTFTNKIIKYSFIFFLVVAILAVLATYSRGGLIGLIVVGTYFVWNSKRKFVWLVVIAVLVGSVSLFLPEKWFDRMSTISEAKQDNSFMGRVIAWKQSTLMAMEQPLTGGGFYAIQDFDVWTRLSRQFHKLDIIPTELPDPEGVHAAHSIYFQVLGDHGFVGFLLYIGIIVTAYFYVSQIIKKTQTVNDETEWISRMAKMLRLSLLAYYVSGAALSMAYFDLAFLYFALVSVLRVRLQEIEVK